MDLPVDFWGPTFKYHQTFNFVFVCPLPGNTKPKKKKKKKKKHMEKVLGEIKAMLRVGKTNNTFVSILK